MWMTDLIDELQGWYALQCNDIWEHSFGVEITNIDNPGWKVKITGAVERSPATIDLERSEVDWVRVHATDREFVGYGGASNLKEILKLAINWLR